MLTHIVLAEGVQLVAHEVVDVAAIGQLLILEILCAAVGGAAEDEHTLALLLCVGQIGADGVQAHVGSQRDKVGLKVAGEVAHGVHLSGLGDVAALDVGDDRHTGLADSLQGIGICLQTLEAKRLVVSDLHLVAARDGLGGVDELLVEADDVLALGEGAVHEICGQVAEIGVQTHADRAACFDCFVKLIHVRHLGFLLFVSLLYKCICSLFFCLIGQLAALDRGADPAVELRTVEGAVVGLGVELVLVHGIEDVEVYQHKVGVIARLELTLGKAQNFRWAGAHQVAQQLEGKSLFLAELGVADAESRLTAHHTGHALELVFLGVGRVVGGDGVHHTAADGVDEGLHIVGGADGRVDAVVAGIIGEPQVVGRHLAGDGCAPQLMRTASTDSLVETWHMCRRVW